MRACWFLLALIVALPALSELQLQQVASDKILYDPGTVAKFTVVVANPDAAAASCILRIALVSDVATRMILVEAPITVAAKGTYESGGTAPMTPVLGMAIEATLLRDGKPFAVKSDVFSCARSVQQVLICGSGNHGGWQFSGRIDKTLATYPKEFASQYRSTYGNFIEKFAWGPSDFDELTPDEDRWWAGQTGYNESKTNIRAMIDAFHAQGLKVVTYGKAAAGGIAGFEKLRRNPDPASYTNGRFLSDNYDVAVLDYHAALGPPKIGEDRMVPGSPQEMEKAGYAGVGRFQPFTQSLDWCSIWYDCGDPRVAAAGINELAGSAKMFGFDGVRFDGEFWVGRTQRLDGTWNLPETTNFETASVSLVKQMKATCWAAKPSYLFGYNTCTDITWSVGRNNVPQAFREKCKDGGLVANEAYAFPGDVPWMDYCKRVRREAELSRYYGGYYATYGFNRGGGNLYNYIYQYALRAHVMNPITGPWPWVNRSATRFGRLLWDDNLTTWYDAAKSVKVTGSTSLAWEEFAAVGDAPDGGTRYIIHLFNPPDSATVFGKQQLPSAPAKDVTVTFLGKVKNAWLVDMEKTEAAPIAAQDGAFAGSYQIGEVPYWKILVIDVDAPRPPKAYDEPAGNAPKTGPSAEDLQLAPKKVDGKSWRYVQEPEQWGGGESTADRETDPDALNGGACVGKPNRPAGAMAYTYQYPRIPGRYTATFRLKVDDNTVDKPVFRLTMALNNQPYLSGLGGLYAEAKDIKATDFAKPNVYQNFTIEFDYADYGFTGACATYLGNVKGSWDRTTLELARPWTNEELADHYKNVKRPDGLLLVDEPAKKVLAVRGLYNRLYRIEDVVGLLGMTLTDTYTGYSQQRGTFLKGYAWDWKALWAQNVMILTNVEAKGLNYGQVFMLQEWVKDGGGLIVLGGNLTLGQDDNMTRCWPNFLPVTLNGPWEVRKCTPPVAFAGSNPKNPAVILYRHMVTPKPGATLLLKGTKGEPLIVGGACGKGKVAVFTGTVLGEAPKGTRAFWATPEWAQALAKTVQWVSDTK
jgi:hypothetical protein